MGRAGTVGLRVAIVATLVASVVAACGDDSRTGTTASPPTVTPTTALRPTPAGPTATVPGGATRAPAAGQADIVIKNSAFSPAQLTVKVGQKVTVVNEDSIPHTFTAERGRFDSGTLQPGQSYTHTFSKVGTHPFLCTIHPQMKGAVIVR